MGAKDYPRYVAGGHRGLTIAAAIVQVFTAPGCCFWVEDTYFLFCYHQFFSLLLHHTQVVITASENTDVEPTLRYAGHVILL